MILVFRIGLKCCTVGMNSLSIQQQQAADFLYCDWSNYIIQATSTEPLDHSQYRGGCPLHINKLVNCACGPSLEKKHSTFNIQLSNICRVRAGTLPCWSVHYSSSSSHKSSFPWSCTLQAGQEQTCSQTQNHKGITITGFSARHDVSDKSCKNTTRWTQTSSWAKQMYKWDQTTSIQLL